MRQTQKVAAISMFAVLLLFVTPSMSFAQEDTRTESDREADRQKELQRERELERERQAEEDRQKRLEDARQRLEEKREKIRMEREAKIDVQRQQLEREVVSEFTERPYKPAPDCPDFGLQLVNPEVDGITDNHMLKCYAKHLKAENDTLKNALVKIWGLMHKLANAYGVVG